MRRSPSHSDQAFENTTPKDGVGMSPAARDALWLTVAVLVVALISVQVDVLERLVEWSRAHEDWELDELFSLLMALAFGVSIYSVRRLRELNREIKLRRDKEEEIRHMAMHDALTGLPNRVLFRQRLDQELERARRKNDHVAVLAVDLDHFKQVNDLFGHAAGDTLLRVVSQRMSDEVRKMDTVARLGGDEFAIIQPGLDQPSGGAVLAQRLLRSIAEPIDLGSNHLVAGISIGIAVSTSADDTPTELLRSADIALYRAKEQGRSTFRYFEPDMDRVLRERQQLELDLREAVANERLELYYQPQFATRSRQLTGFEALLRWNHPTRGMVSPVDFIPIAEDTGLIRPLGDWVLKTACRVAAAWPQDLSIAVNVSPVQFAQPGLAERVAVILAETGLEADRLELEITERILMHETEETLKILHHLKDLGVRISMDDFGTGFSSLSYLRRFPFDNLKIDRSFISDLEHNTDDAAIVRAVVALGESLGMTTTAEGIENELQLDYLVDEGCQQAQGFMLGRPMPLGQAEAIIRDQHVSLARSASV
ncbi:MAG: EAL domain-containing protein [Chromatiales bacterium]|nr:EAL domain-containing protein [Chromatiales bacterium]